MENLEIEFTRVNNDTNGNPRYVCHFLNFIKEGETGSITDKYNLAIYRAKKLGGRKFHNKQYGGGIVFNAVNLQFLKNKIINLLKEI